MKIIKVDRHPPPKPRTQVTATVELDRLDVILLRFMFLHESPVSRHPSLALLDRINAAAETAGGHNDNWESTGHIQETYAKLWTQLFDDIDLSG